MIEPCYKGFKSGQITIVGKGNKRRNIRINQTVYDLFQKIYQEKNSLYVFPSIKTGKHISKVNKAFKMFLKRLELRIFIFTICGIQQLMDGSGW